MENEIIVAVRDIKKGDRFHDERGRLNWTATGDATLTESGDVRLGVQFVDGGTGVREWSARDASWQIAVERGQG
jgi:hypothetical protein